MTSHYNDNSSKMPVRKKKTQRLKHLFEVPPAAEASQFFYHSVLKFTSVVLQVHNANRESKKVNLALRLPQLLIEVLFPTTSYCRYCSKTSSDILSVRFFQVLIKKSLSPAQLKCRNQSILVFRKFVKFL